MDNSHFFGIFVFMRIATLNASLLNSNHGTIRGGSFLSSITLFFSCISQIINTRANS